MQLLWLAGELIILYFISRSLTQAIYDFTYLVFRARSVAVTAVTLLTFPGTVIHELSHLFTAEVLGVHTGKLTLVPENIQSEEIRAGSVMIAETDPFRRYAIGLAPLFVGIVVLIAISYGLTLTTTWGTWQVWGDIGLGYLLFAVSNAMFSSPEDLKGFIPFAVTLLIMAALFYYMGLRIGLTGVLLTIVTNIFTALINSLGIVLGINIGGFFIFKGFILLAQRVTHRKIIRR